MEIYYYDNKVEKQCTDFNRAKREFPLKVAKRLHKLINFIENAENLESVINMPQFSFHALKGDKKGYYALDIDGRRSSYRLITSFGESEDRVFFDNISIKNITVKEVSKHYE